MLLLRTKTRPSFTFRASIRSFTHSRSISSAQFKMGDVNNNPATAKKLINLLRGWPNPALLPSAAIAAASQTALSDPKVSVPALCYGPDPGYEPLREEIAKWLAEFYPDSHPTLGGNVTGEQGNVSNGVTANRGADRFCITGGASQNLACALQVFTDPVTTRVWMVAPCYYLACRIFEDSGLRCRAVAEGEMGIDLEALERGFWESEEEDEGLKALKHPKPWSKFYRHIIYLVPTFSNPSGKTMPLSHRQSLVRLARKYDALIVTDDVYDFLQWPTTSDTSSSSLTTSPVPRLVDVDRTLTPVPAPDSFGNAMSNGSFSKIVGPGVRTGWAEAAPKFTYGLSQTGSSRSGGAPSQLVATFMAGLLKSGRIQEHIQTVLKPAYKKRYEVTVRAIREYLLPLGVKLGEVSFGEKNIFGGFFIWLELPKNINAQALAATAKAEENLIVSPGHAFEVQRDETIRFENSIRLCFAWEELEDLVEGVKRLARVVKTADEGNVKKASRSGNADKDHLK